MHRLRYLFRIARRSLWSLVTAFFAVSGAVTFLRDEFASPPWQQMLKVPPWLPDWPWYWWVIAALVTGLFAILDGAYREHRDQQRHLLQAKKSTAAGTYDEEDASWALRYLITESVWAWKTFAVLNTWDSVRGDELEEFRRVARDKGLRIRGFPSNGGPPDRVDPTHWIGAVIDPVTASTRDGVATKSLSPAHHGRNTFGGLRVSKFDVEDAWPKATRVRKLLTPWFVALKLNMLDMGYPSPIGDLTNWLVTKQLERRKRSESE